MNIEAIIRQISNCDEVTAKMRLHEVQKMHDFLNAIRSGEVQARKEWVNSSSLIFPEDFAEEMNKLSVDLRPVENMLKQCERIEDALKKQLERLKKL